MNVLFYGPGLLDSNRLAVKECHDDGAAEACTFHLVQVCQYVLVRVEQSHRVDSAPVRAWSFKYWTETFYLFYGSLGHH